MAYLASIHKPSSIRHALKLNFFGPEEECLVVAKSNVLEFYALTENGLALHHSRKIYGKVTMLERLRPASAETDHLFVCTDRYTYFTVSWDTKRKILQTEKDFVDLADSGARDTQTGEKHAVDPSRRFVVLELFEGILTVVPIKHKLKSKRKLDDYGNLGESTQARIPELFVRSFAFIHGAEKPSLALLWEDSHNKAHVTTKELTYTGPSSSDSGAVEFTDTSPKLANLPDQGASHIIPVSEPACGVILLGESSVIYIGHTKADETKTLMLRQPTVFVAWTQRSDTVFLLADDYGQMQIMDLTVIDDKLEEISLTHVGTTSRAMTLIKLSDDYMFVGSHQGDSQVVKIDYQQPSLEVIQTITNVAPILDFTIMDLGTRAGDVYMNEFASGQARIVTGSGAFEDGSLRTIRSGVGLEDKAILPYMKGIFDLFGLRSLGSEAALDILLISLFNGTRVLKFRDNGEIQELNEFLGLSMEQSTLVAANVNGNRIVQVTKAFVRLVDLEGGVLVADWNPPKDVSIVDASVNREKVLLSVGGKRLVVLDVRSGLAVDADKIMPGDKQLGYVHVGMSSSEIGAVGIWQGTEVWMIRLDTLEAVHKESLAVPGELNVPRSILLTQVLEERPLTLFVAMAEGTVHTFSVDPFDFALRNKKSMVLGIKESKFKVLPREDGLNNVLATCEHPNLIYGSEGRIVYSAVSANDVACVCNFDAALYPRSVIVATRKELKISLIDEERRTYVQDLHLKETVRRVAYSKKLRGFGVGTIKREVEAGIETIKSHVKLVDEVLFDLLDTYDLNTDELIESVIRAELDDGKDGLVERLVVGTGYIDHTRDESVRGRIIVFEVDEDRTLRAETELAVRGACRCLGVLDGGIVAALTKSVVVYSLQHTSARPSIVKRASYRTFTAPIDLAVTGNLIVVADLMKSVCVVEFNPGKAGSSDRLEEVARHFLTVWSTAVAPVAEDTYLEGDAEGNLMVLQQNRQGVMAEDRRRLEVTSEILLGEMVNRIRAISVPVSGDPVVIPRAFITTVEGGIYLFALISPKRRDILMRLQAKMAKRLESPGRMSFNKYRAFKNSVREADEPFRFVDGDLIERFLDCDEILQEEIVDGLDMAVEAVRTMVEGLKRLR